MHNPLGSSDPDFAAAERSEGEPDGELAEITPIDGLIDTTAERPEGLELPTRKVGGVKSGKRPADFKPVPKGPITRPTAVVIEAPTPQLTPTLAAVTLPQQSVPPALTKPTPVALTPTTEDLFSFLDDPVPIQDGLVWNETRSTGYRPVLVKDTQPEFLKDFAKALVEQRANITWVPGLGTPLGDWLFPLLQEALNGPFNRAPRLQRIEGHQIFQFVWTGWVRNIAGRSYFVVYEMQLVPSFQPTKVLMVDTNSLF